MFASLQVKNMHHYRITMRKVVKWFHKGCYTCFTAHKTLFLLCEVIYTPATVSIMYYQSDGFNKTSVASSQLLHNSLKDPYFTSFQFSFFILYSSGAAANN